ncbi:MAG: HAMP domain-containing histidine kinase, partial [Variovorax sp.]|nr:HAMP domain-containing histidine kinase [Variovorax sp.]
MKATAIRAARRGEKSCLQPGAPPFEMQDGWALGFVTRIAICEITSNASQPAQDDWCVVGNTVRSRSGLLRGAAAAYDRFNRENERKKVVQHRGPLSRRIRGGRIKKHGYFVNLYHTGGAQSALQTPRDVRAATRLRCATRDRALAIISHELRQPLNVIQLNTRLLQNLPASAGPSQLQGIAKAMQRAIESQTRLIDDLLDFSRLRTGKLALRRSEVDFGALALDLVAAFAARWPSGRLRAQVLAADPLICHADPVRLEQIVGNLLDNAMKFSPGSAQVQVRLSSEDGFARLA